MALGLVSCHPHVLHQAGDRPEHSRTSKKAGAGLSSTRAGVYLQLREIDPCKCLQTLHGRHRRTLRANTFQTLTLQQVVSVSGADMGCSSVSPFCCKVPCHGLPQNAWQVSDVSCDLLLTKALQGGATHGSLLLTSSSPNRLLGRVCRCRLKPGPLEAKVPPVFLCRCMAALEPSLVRIQIAGQEGCMCSGTGRRTRTSGFSERKMRPPDSPWQDRRRCASSRSSVSALGRWALPDPIGSGD